MINYKESVISVIVPVYNIENYIEECLNSIINQTYRALEIIIVDDGSTDSSYKICEQYKKRDHRIKLIHQENMNLVTDASSKINLNWSVNSFVSDGLYYVKAVLVDDKKRKTIKSAKIFVYKQ